MARLRNSQPPSPPGLNHRTGPTPQTKRDRHTIASLARPAHAPAMFFCGAAFFLRLVSVSMQCSWQCPSARTFLLHGLQLVFCTDFSWANAFQHFLTALLFWPASGLPLACLTPPLASSRPRIEID